MRDRLAEALSRDFAEQSMIKESEEWTDGSGRKTWEEEVLESSRVVRWLAEP